MRITLALLFLGAVVLAGCTDNEDDAASGPATIHGTVTLHGDWPVVGDIQVSLFGAWDTTLALALAPGGPPEFNTEPLSSPNAAQQVHLVEFEITDINPGTYNCLTVGWRNGGQQGLDEPVLGLYGGDFAAGDTLPTNITLSAGQDLELNFDGWLDRIPEVVDLQPGEVGGVVQFEDSWPTAYPGYYVLLMASADPATPSMPLAMVAVSAGDPAFLLSVQFADSLDCHLAVYGYPYANALDAFYGGYGWDWNAGTPALGTLTLRADEPGIGDLVVTCRSGE